MRATETPPAVLKYYLYRAVSHPGFTYPIYTLFLLRSGLSFTEIGAIASVQSLVVVAGEVPTGYVGDRIGRRNSLFVASLLFLVSNASYLVATDFPGFLFTFTTLSLGGTFVSGSGDAWLYDTLDEHDMAEQYTHVNGRAGAVAKWVSTVGMIAGGLLYVVNPFYPFVVAVGLSLVSVGTVLTLPKNAQYAGRVVAVDADESAGGEAADGDGDTSDSSAGLTIVEALPLVKEQLSQPSMRAFIAYLALVGGALMTADMYIQPVARDALKASFGATLNAWGVPEAATLGLLYAAFTVVSAIASDYAGDVEDRFGVRAALFSIPFVVAVLYLLPAFVPILAFPMFFVMKGGFTLFWPITSRYMNDRIDSAGRATVLSVVSMLRAVAGVPFRIASGVVADGTTVLVAVAALGGAFIICAGVLLVVTTPVKTDVSAPTSTN